MRHIQSPRKSVLVTGDAGFVGRNLVCGLEHAGYEVHGYRQRLADGDIAQPGGLTAFNDLPIDAVVHLAARIPQTGDWDPSADLYRVNVTGTARVLEYCRHRRVPLIHMSCAAVYGAGAPALLKEEHTPAPDTTYGISKLRAERRCRRYALDYGLPVTILRADLIYGAGQPQDSSIARLARQMRAGNAVCYSEDGSGRDAVHVDDVVRGIMLALHRPGQGLRIYNLGTGHARTVTDLCERLAVLMRYEGCVSVDERSSPARSRETALDSRRAERDLGWSKPMDPYQGLARTFGLPELRPHCEKPGGADRASAVSA